MVVVLPNDLARGEEGSGRFVSLEVPELPMLGVAALVVLAGRERSPASVVMVDEIRERCRPLALAVSAKPVLPR